jgi:hypothetical protein
MRAMAHSRVSELCSQVEQGDEARRHLSAALLMLEELGARSDVLDRFRWALAQVNLQLGAIDEAERWVAQTAPNWVGEAVSALTFDLGVRAEIVLARGEVEAGLRLWRRAVDRLTNTESEIVGIGPSRDPWALEVEAVAVVAHAHHGGSTSSRRSPASCRTSCRRC